MTQISYQLTPRLESFAAVVEAAIIASGAQTVCDLGGGANPLLSPDFVKRAGIRYVVLDRSAEQLSLCPSPYEKLLVDLERPGVATAATADLVFSKHVLEHLRRPRAFHLNVRRMLPRGGIALHYFPTLYSPPFLANRLLPDRLTSRILPMFIEGRESSGAHGKFRAYYRWCRGPTERQVQRFRSTSFAVDEYVGYFDSSYLRRWRPLETLERDASRWLTRHPLPLLTSFARVRLLAT